jgi:predicted Zn-dependent protease
MQVLLHEFGHVLGLDHVSKKNDLMSTQVSGGKTDFNKQTKEYFLNNPGCVK